MPAPTYIASTVLTGLLLVVLVVALARTRQWRSATTTIEGASHASTATALAETARTPLGWTVAFFLLVIGFGGGTLVFVTGSVPTAVSRSAGVVLALVFAAALGGYLFWGVYHSARYRGLKSAQATGAGLWVLGLLFIVAIVVKLLMA